MHTKKIKLKYFAMLSEKFGMREESIELTGDIKTLADLKRYLATRGDQWKKYLLDAREIAVAVNQTIMQDDVELTSNDEVAFLPPVSGG